MLSLKEADKILKEHKEELYKKYKSLMPPTAAPRKDEKGVFSG